MATVIVKVDQIGNTASKGSARGFELVMDRPDAKGGSNQGMIGGRGAAEWAGWLFNEQFAGRSQSWKY